MQVTNVLPGQLTAWPDHKQLPSKDDSMPTNFQEHPQANLLTECLLPRLRDLFLDGQYTIGHDSFIYWRNVLPPGDGSKAPDWFLVTGVPPMLDGDFRRSYVVWQEIVKPLLVVEFVSGDGSEERDATPYKGKFWVYEQGISAALYAIYEVEKPAIELFKLDQGRYVPVPANAAGRVPIDRLGVELGIWQGVYRGMDLPWMRLWDVNGNLLPTAEEHAEVERQRANSEKQRAENAESLLDDFRKQAEEEAERVSKFREKLRAAGIDPDAP